MLDGHVKTYIFDKDGDNLVYLFVGQIEVSRLVDGLLVLDNIGITLVTDGRVTPG